MPVEDNQQLQDVLQATKDLRLAEQMILGESLRVKNERIRELESEVRLLKDLLNHWQAVPQPQVSPAGRKLQVPRRWRVKTV